MYGPDFNNTLENERPTGLIITPGIPSPHDNCVVRFFRKIFNFNF